MFHLKRYKIFVVYSDNLFSYCIIQLLDVLILKIRSSRVT